MTTTSTRPQHRQPTLLLVVLLLASLVVVATPGPASAACDPGAPAAAPVLRPDTAYAEFKPGDPARFSGTVQVDCGWRYRQFGQPTGQAFIDYLDANGTLLGSSDVTGQVSVAADGTISGTASTIFSGDRANAKRLTFRIKLTGGTSPTAEVSSPAVPVDGTPPAIRSYALITTTTVQVDFTEPVTVAGGDRVTDWRVDDQRPVEVTGSGVSRVLRMATAFDPDATPEVFYRPFDPLNPNRDEYRDAAGNSLTDANRIAPANDAIPPAVPTIPTIEGRSTSGGPVLGGALQPTVTIGNVRGGHRVQLWRDGLVDATRQFDGGSPDILLAEVTVPSGATQVTVVASDYRTALPSQDLTHTFYALAIDPAGNRSADVGRAQYRVDPKAPAVVSPAVGDGAFVTVAFTEAIAGANRAGEWAVSSGGPVVSVSGSGDTRVVRTSSTASGSISWSSSDPADAYADSSGNRLPAFTVPIVTSGGLNLAAGPAVTEGSPLTFTVTVARASNDTRTYGVSYATESGTAVAGTDFTAVSGTLTFGPGETSKTVSVPTLEDELTEGDETVRLRLSNPTNGATLPSNPVATGIIKDPTGLPAVSVFDTRANEGTTARAVVQLDRSAPKDVTVRWRTRDGSATAGEDYPAGAGTLRIAKGATQAEILLPLTDDGATEPTETFTIELSDPVDATLGRSVATVTILDGLGVPPGQGRVAGATRVETSVEISKTFYASADTVVIATANAYPDALAGAPLADANDAPILLSTPEALHPATKAEVTRLGARTAIVLGGGKALSAKVDDDLRAAGVRTVRRIAGRNRFETAQRIAEELGGSSVYVVQGAAADPKRGWPDAVAVSALAAHQQRPILLVERDRLPSETRAALRSLKAGQATIVGGTAAVNDAVAKAIDAEAGTVSRIAGRTRYETSAAVAAASKQAGLSPANTWFATGDDWPDSLSASPAVARTGGILLLVDSDRLDDSPPARTWLVDHRSVLESITLVGGRKAISDAVAAQIRSQSGLQPR